MVPNLNGLVRSISMVFNLKDDLVGGLEILQGILFHIRAWFWSHVSSSHFAQESHCTMLSEAYPCTISLTCHKHLRGWSTLFGWPIQKHPWPIQKYPSSFLQMHPLFRSIAFACIHPCGCVIFLPGVHGGKARRKSMEQATVSYLNRLCSEVLLVRKEA